MLAKLDVVFFWQWLAPITCGGLLAGIRPYPIETNAKCVSAAGLDLATTPLKWSNDGGSDLIKRSLN